MKKTLYSICCLSVLFMSCGSDDDSVNGLTCAEATQNTLTALTSFTNAGSSDYETLCNAYKLNLQQQKDACGDSSGQIQIILDTLGDCVDDTSESTGDRNN